MNIQQLRNKLISKISAINDKDLLLQLETWLGKKTLINTDLKAIQELNIKDSDPVTIRLAGKKSNVVSWEQVFVLGACWVLEEKRIFKLDKPISDHYEKTKYAMSNEPYHADGKLFTSQALYNLVHLETHRSAEDQLKTLQYIFDYFKLNSSDLKISFLGSPNQNGTG